MLKQISRLESKVAEKTAHLYIDSDTPLNVVKEMLFQFTTYLGHLEATIKSNQEAVKVEEQKSDEAKNESVDMVEEVINEDSSCNGRCC